MVSISIDSIEKLSRRMGSAGKKTPEAQEAFPFKVLADPDFSIFRKYGAFDHFENGPMHGTFLISSGGSILWSDIGHQPFGYPEPLLKEAKRLIALENVRSPLQK